MEPATPAILSMTEITNFESVKSLKNNGSATVWSPQKKLNPNQPTPRIIILAGVIATGLFKAGSLLFRSMRGESCMD